MKKNLFVALVSSQFLIYAAVASLGSELEGTLAACKYGENRPALPFADVKVKEGESRDVSSALTSKWKKIPSSEIDFDSFQKAPDRYEYRSALCEEALQRAIKKKLGSSAATNVLKNRCSALNQDRGYRDEAKGSGNSWVQSHSDSVSRTDAEGYWCEGDQADSNDLIEIACAALRANRDLRNEQSKSYQAALKNLKKNCSSVSVASRGLASRDEPSLDDEDSDAEDEAVYQGRHVPRALPGDMNVPVIQRIVSVPYMPPRPGCAQGAARALVINPPGGALYTVANAAIAGLGAVLSYKGARHADDLRYKVAQSTIDAYKAVGAVPDLYAGRMFWGQGGVYPFGGGPIRGGVCGSPPFNTGFTGCMGGMPGHLPVGPGGIYGNGFFPGGGCGGMGGGIPGGFPGGINGGFPGGGMIPRSPCGTPWGMGPSPYGANPYMNNPAMMGRPSGFMGPVNPMLLDQERQRLQDLQNQIARQRAQMNQLNSLNNQLLSLDQNRNQLLNRLQGYNGLLSNLNGPGGFNGNPGVYNPYGGMRPGGMGGFPGGGMGGFPAGGMMPGMGGIPGGGMGGGGIMGGGCPTLTCYPGNAGAYYSPPMIYGNSGFGGSAFGFPNRNNLSFGINYTNSGY